MIPRFNYRFSLRDVWHSLQSLIMPVKPVADTLSKLFPGALLHEISSARVGVCYALRAFGLPPGARVGVQPYTCSSVLTAIVAAGCQPVFIDINQQLTLDGEDLRRKLPRLDALIVTHTFGIPADIDQIKRLAGHLPILEDCAHAFLCHYENVLLGCFFDAAVFSFGNGKFPSLGGGGLLVINNRQYAEHVAKQVHGLTRPGLVSELAFVGKRLLNALLHSHQGERLLHSLLNETMTERKNQSVLPYPARDQRPHRSIGAALQQQVEKLDIRARQQHTNARYITGQHRENYNMLIPPASVGHAFAVVLLTNRRDDLYRHLRQNGVGAGKHFQYAQTWAVQFGYRPGECPSFERLVGRVLTIPCHYTLTTNELQLIDQVLTQFKLNRYVTV